MVEVTEILLRVIRKVIYAIKRERRYFPPLRLVFFFFFIAIGIALPCFSAASRVRYILPLVPQRYPPLTWRTGIIKLQMQHLTTLQKLPMQLHQVCL